MLCSIILLVFPYTLLTCRIFVKQKNIFKKCVKKSIFILFFIVYFTWKVEKSFPLSISKMLESPETFNRLRRIILEQMISWQINYKQFAIFRGNNSSIFNRIFESCCRINANNIRRCSTDRYLKKNKSCVTKNQSCVISRDFPNSF